MKTLRLIEKAYWDSYLLTLPAEEKPPKPRIEAAFAGDKTTTDNLLSLYLEGKKIAGSSILEDFETAGDPLPKVGNYWIILDSKNRPGCLVKTYKIVLNAFKNIPVEIAIAEGEGDCTVEYWKKIHSELYKPRLAEWGIKNIEDATVITEFFEVVYK